MNYVLDSNGSNVVSKIRIRYCENLLFVVV